MNIIDGKALATKMREDLRIKIEKMSGMCVEILKNT